MYCTVYYRISNTSFLRCVQYFTPSWDLYSTLLLSSKYVQYITPFLRYVQYSILIVSSDMFSILLLSSYMRSILLLSSFMFGKFLLTLDVYTPQYRGSIFQYLFPCPLLKIIFSPSHSTLFFDSHCGLFALILPYFAIILPFFIPFSHFLSSFFLFLSSFFLFSFLFLPFSLKFSPFFSSPFHIFSPKWHWLIFTPPPGGYFPIYRPLSQYITPLLRYVYIFRLNLFKQICIV